LREEIEQLDWSSIGNDEPGSHEVELYSDVILYVPEAAQVLVRVEFGLPAAMAVEGALYTIPDALTTQPSNVSAIAGTSFLPTPNPCRGSGGGGSRAAGLQFKASEVACSGTGGGGH
jgi:hypothetical protein